jgi:hypothetical protein
MSGEQGADAPAASEDGAEPTSVQAAGPCEESAEGLGDSELADEQPQEELIQAATIDQTQAIRMRRLRLAAA